MRNKLKKITLLAIITFVACLFSYVSSVPANGYIFAAGAKPDLIIYSDLTGDEILQGDEREFSVSIKLNDSAGTRLGGFEASLLYDSDAFVFVRDEYDEYPSGFPNFMINVPADGEIKMVAFSTTSAGVASSINFCTFKFKLKSGAQTGTYEFNFSSTLNLATSVGTGSTPIDADIVPLSVDVVGVQLSKDTTLSALTISVGSFNPSFPSGTIRNYTATVPYGTESFSITATANDVDAVIQGGDRTKTFTINKPFPETLSIPVEAASGTVEDYVITIVEALPSSDSALKSLSVVGFLLDSAFSSGKLEYNLQVPSGTTSVTVNAEANSKFASVAGTGVKTLSSPVNDTINVTVTAQDGSQKIYKIIVTAIPLSSDAKLANITLGVSPVSAFTFSENQFSYDVVLPFGTSAITVTPSLKNNGSSIQSANLTLSSFPGTISIVVLAENLSDTKTYVINVTVATAEDNCYLTELFYSGITILKNGDSWTSSVPYAVNDLNVTTLRNGATVSAGAKVSFLVNNVPVYGAQILLMEGAQTDIKIVVTSQSGNHSNTYLLSVTRATGDTVNTINKNSLSITNNSSALGGSWNGNQYKVSGEIPYDQKGNIKISVAADSSFATMTLDSVILYSNQPTSISGLVSGDNSISLIVTPEKGQQSAYTIIITVASAPSSSNDITGISYNGSVADYTDTNIWTLFVPYGTQNLMVNSISVAVPSGATYVLEYDMYPATIIALQVSKEQRITIKVTAESGAKKTYLLKVIRATDQFGLQEIISSIEDAKLQPGDFGGASWLKLQNALAAAKAELLNPNATAESFTAVQIAVEDAYSQLVDVKSISELTVLIDGLIPSQYPTGAWAALQSAMAGLTSILNTGTQEQVDAKYAAIKVAFDDLLPAIIRDAVLSAETQLNSKGGASKVTMESYAKFDAAMKHLKSLLDNPNATKAQIDDAVATMVSATAGLQLKDEPSGSASQIPDWMPIIGGIIVLLLVALLISNYKNKNYLLHQARREDGGVKVQDSHVAVPAQSVQPVSQVQNLPSQNISHERPDALSLQMSGIILTKAMEALFDNKKTMERDGVTNEEVKHLINKALTQFKNELMSAKRSTDTRNDTDDFKK